MADDVTKDAGVDSKVDDVKDNPAQQLTVGPKDPEHGERPYEYAARVAAATTVKGPAHMEPTTTHYWGGNSEFRSTGVVPMPNGEVLTDDMAAEVKRHAGMQRVAAEGERDDGKGEHDGALVPVHDEPTEENTRPE